MSVSSEREAYRNGLTDLSQQITAAASTASAGMAGSAVPPAPPPATEPATQAVINIRAAASEEAKAYNKNLGRGAAVIYVAVAVVVVAIVGASPAGDYKMALAVATGFVVLGIGLAWLTLVRDGWNTGGFLRAIRGADGRISTSKAQAGLWTLLLTFALSFFVASVLFQVMTVTQFAALAAAFSPTYLLLLGGPFAAAALARLNFDVKKDDGSVQKTDAYGMELKNLVSDDSGEVSLNDSQFFLFNLVAAGTFVVLLAITPTSLPVIPQTLIGLTSISALAYVTTKTVSNQRPVITTIVSAQLATSGVAPAAALAAGDWAEIRGSNFVVPGADDVESKAQVRVRFGTTETGVEGRRPDGNGTNPLPSSIYVQIPAGLTGQVEVKVITASGVESQGYPLVLA